jgi:hypothetical protein
VCLVSDDIVGDYREVWLATFSRWWSKDAVLVRASNRQSALRAIERELPERAARLRKLVRAPLPIAVQASVDPPLARRIRVIFGE